MQQTKIYHKILRCFLTKTINRKLTKLNDKTEDINRTIQKTNLLRKSNPPNLVKKRRNETEQKHTHFKKHQKKIIPPIFHKNKTTKYQIANITMEFTCGKTAKL